MLPCSKRYVHDWTTCPFAHPQEKARRRDPRIYNYTGIACPNMKKARPVGVQRRNGSWEGAWWRVLTGGWEGG